MKFKNILAFLFTLLALILVFSGGVWFSYRYFTRPSKKNYCEHFSVILESEVENVQLNIGEGKLVKVKLVNLGFEDEFRIKIDGPEWVVVKPEIIRLMTNELENIFVYMSPSFGTEGTFYVKISANSYCGSEGESIRVEV